ncbi:hypothetical protein HHI36_004653 [Cryptolaemus montrouzieri]|uniref:RING-type E3 ubiquitin transferase n=1 Tax=Cryptolaemus montrouzieri TaxID=559131 RepID=A0ABD2NS38_9CUCU
MDSFQKQLYQTKIRCSECSAHVFGTINGTAKAGVSISCGKCVAKKITDQKTYFGAIKTGIHLPCPSYQYGCDQVLPKEKLNEHNHCPYGLTVCSSFANCVDVYHYHEVEDHYKVKHPECIRKFESQTYIYSYRSSPIYEEGFVIVPAFDHRFKIMWRANFMNCKLEYLGCNFGFVDSLEKYGFMIRLNRYRQFLGFKSEFYFCPLGGVEEVDFHKLMGEGKSVILQFENELKMQLFLKLKHLYGFVTIFKS